jgi:formate-dependent nitrite reductase membrane component NrfD
LLVFKVLSIRVSLHSFQAQVSEPGRSYGRDDLDFAVGFEFEWLPILVALGVVVLLLAVYFAVVALSPTKAGKRARRRRAKSHRSKTPTRREKATTLFGFLIVASMLGAAVALRTNEAVFDGDLAWWLVSAVIGLIGILSIVGYMAWLESRTK